jgi:hypothetical protein
VAGQLGSRAARSEPGGLIRTIYISIGNSDDKLTQFDWSGYVNEVGQTIRSLAHKIHFSGMSASTEPWQNAAWVFDIATINREAELGENLAVLAKLYRQESIAWAALGPVDFIRP